MKVQSKRTDASVVNSAEFLVDQDNVHWKALVNETFNYFLYKISL